jgi:hypothetical protein
VIPTEPLSPTPPTRIAENKEKGHDDPEPADEGEIQMEYSSD